MSATFNKEPEGAKEDLMKREDYFTVEVFAPRSTQSKKFRWAKTLQVGAAADEAAKAFDYESGSPTLQNKDGKVLDRKMTLVEAGVHNFDHLELTDKGGGV